MRASPGVALACVLAAAGAGAQTVDPAYRDSYVGAILEGSAEWRRVPGQERWRLADDPPERTRRARIPLDGPGDPFHRRLRDSRGRPFGVPSFEDPLR